jgi:hypothetical protein
MPDFQTKIRKHLSFILLFILFIVTGLLIYKDYGLSWDENMQRFNNGYVNYNFIVNEDYKSLKEGHEKYHGPAFELLLIAIERISNLTNDGDIFRLRHLINFLFFCIGILFFYIIVYKQFKSVFIATIGTAMLILSPRIFADAFYNSKDIPFLVMTVLSIYSTCIFLRSRNVLLIFFHSLISAWLIDIRILGIIIPLFTIFYTIIKSSFINEFKKELWKLILYILFLIPLIILFWPILWKNPVNNFINAFVEMSKFNWAGNVRFMGEIINVEHLPWNYIPVWIGITTPELYLVLFISGCVVFISQLCKSVRHNFTAIFNYDFEWLNIYLIFFTFFSIIIFQSVLYDGWRHVYFIYPSIIFIALIGLNWINKYLKQANLSFIYKSILVFSLISTLYVIFILHPYQNIYFNSLTRNSLKDIKKRFDMDYWGLTFFEGLQFLLSADSTNTIKVIAGTYPGELNSILLDNDEQKRLIFTDKLESSDYLITNYREHVEDYNFPVLYSVRRGDADLMTVYITNPLHHMLLKQGSIIYRSFNNFNENRPEWFGGSRNTIKDNNVCSITPEEEFSSTFQLVADSFFQENVNLTLNASVKISSADSLNYIFIVQLESINGQTYFWKEKHGFYNAETDWDPIHLFTSLPKLNSRDKLKVFIYNKDRKSMNLDDFEINILSVR